MALQPNVQGPSCNECAAGTFSLQAGNPKGCTDCFCFGVTSQCKSSTFVKTKVCTRFSWMSSHDLIVYLLKINEMDGWNASGAGQVKRDGNSVEFIPSAEAQNGKAKAFYFLAPKQYLGKQINSYGSKLTYRLSSTSESSARILSADVVLKVGLKNFFSHKKSLNLVRLGCQRKCRVLGGRVAPGCQRRIRNYGSSNSGRNRTFFLHVKVLLYFFPIF